MMAAKEIAVKRYVVKLNADERQRLQELIRKGASPAQRLLKARILLKADASDAGEALSDRKIIEALDTSVSTVYRAHSARRRPAYKSLRRKALFYLQRSQRHV